MSSREEGAWLSSLAGCVIGVDVGGTNTDTAILCGSRVVTSAKRPTTKDVSEGIVNSIRAALGSLSPADAARVVSGLARVTIGTTHFTNAVQERSTRLRKVAVIRLCGTASIGLPPFVDFLPDLHNLICGDYYLVGGGLEYNGDEISPLDDRELRTCVKAMLANKPPVKNVVISAVFAPRDSPTEGQELRAARIVQAACPDISCTLSHQIGHLGLLERENAAILNESLKPLAEDTVAGFTKALADLGMKCPVFLTQNDGTMIRADYAKQFPILTYSSGPTNSMRGAGFLTKLSNAIVVDIGGTTTDVGVLEGGFPRQASTHCVVGDVRTNFCMPDTRSIPLGGGTIVRYDNTSRVLELGPDSVGYEITERAICCGGDTCTTTDVAIAAGVAMPTFCTAEERAASLRAGLVCAVMREIRKLLEAIIDSMKTESKDVTVVLVGGGSILVEKGVTLKGVSNVIVPPKYWDVANAVGAALGTVGGSCDRIEDMVWLQRELCNSDPAASSLSETELYKRARQVALQRAEEIARQNAVEKGAIESTVRIHHNDVIEIAYVPNCLRVKAKAIGDLDSVHSEPSSSPQPSPRHNDDDGDAMETGTEPQPPKRRRSTDNPHWPNSSAEDAAADRAAKLTPPTLEGDVWVLTLEDVRCLAVGAGIMGCGGGGDTYQGLLEAQLLLKEGLSIKLLNPYRVDASCMGLCCGVAFMGAPAIQLEKLVNGTETVVALNEMRRVLASGVCEVGEGRVGSAAVRVEQEYITADGETFPVYIANEEDLSEVDYKNTASVPLRRRVTAIFCGEAGGCNSIEPLLVGARSQLPVLDADEMGRAFPELQMGIPFIHGMPPFPSTIADNKGRVIALTSVATPKQLENFFRQETIQMGMSAAVAMTVLTFEQVLQHCVLFSLSHAWQLGRVVMRARNTHTNIAQAIVEQQNGLVLIVGKVVSVVRATLEGFTRVEATVEGLEGYTGHKVEVQAKNENYIAQHVGGAVLACTPDLISVIDSDTGEPVTTEQVRYGMRVGVIVLHANPALTTPEALRVVGPRAFDYPLDYRPPQGLPSSCC